VTLMVSLTGIRSEGVTSGLSAILTFSLIGIRSGSGTPLPLTAKLTFMLGPPPVICSYQLMVPE